MHSSEQADLKGSCGDGCGSCPIASSATPAHEAPYSGTKLGWVSLFYFIVPILVALVGTAIVPGDQGSQALGGFGGLALGIIFCTVMARRWSLARLQEQRIQREHRWKEKQQCEEKTP